ncbi:hypothetical protein KY386_03065 [Candidatus Parcubacteria bacterium]|nr:hypothetical protein [Candidatus Parcubacteria bacterium]
MLVTAKGDSNMLVTASGWANDTHTLYTRNGCKIRNGDAYKDSKGVYLVTDNALDLPVMHGLVPIREWIGRKIHKVTWISGSEGAFVPGFNRRDSSAIACFVTFRDGDKSEPVGEAGVLSRHSSDDGNDWTTLARVGPSFADAVRRAESERAEAKQHQERVAALRAERKQLQQELLPADRGRARQLYREIEKKEREVERLGHHGGYSVLALDTLRGWIPELVDPFNEQGTANGKVIASIHQIQACEGFRSASFYILQFRDGTFSVPVGSWQGFPLELPVEALATTGLVPGSAVLELQEKLAQERAARDRQRANDARLFGLRQQLDQFGLDADTTQQILREIAVLEGN